MLEALQIENNELQNEVSRFEWYKEHTAGNETQLQIINCQATLLEELLRNSKESNKRKSK